MDDEHGKEIMKKMTNYGIKLNWDSFNHEVLLQKKLDKDLVEAEIKRSLDIPEVFWLNKKIIATRANEKGIRFTSFNKEALKARSTDPLFKLVYEWSKLNQYLNMYGVELRDKMDENGRMHSDWYWDGTSTHRITAKNPAVQAFPIELRQHLTAPEGRCLISGDFSQIELRLAGEMADDHNLMALFEDDGDIYSSVGASIYRKPLSEVTEEERKLCKIVVLGTCYGMGSTSLAEKLFGVTTSQAKSEARQIQYKFLNQFPQLSNWLRERGNNPEGISLGRTYRYQELEKRGSRIAVPVQASCSEGFKQCVLLLDKRLTSSASMVVLLHDEVILEVDLDHQIYYENLLRETMIEGMQQIAKKVNIKVNTKIIGGKNDVN